MKKILNLNEKLFFLCVIIFFYMLEFSILSSCEINFSFCDLYGQSRLCAYAIHGIDPFKFIGNNVEPIKGIGTIPLGWGTSPWGLLLGNLFYPGFLSIKIVKCSFLLINISVLICTAFISYNYICQYSKNFAYIIFLLIILNPSFMHSVGQGNAGGLIGCFLLLSYIYNKNYIMSGIFLSIAAVKPQVALPFIFTFLLLKKIKPLCVCVSICLFSTIFISYITNVSLLTLMSEFAALKTGGIHCYSGIFTLLKIYNIHSNIPLLLSMIFGIVFISIIFIFLKNKIDDIYIIFITCITCTFWCYSFQNDTFILVIPSILYIIYAYKCNYIYCKILFFLCSMYCYFDQFFTKFFSFFAKYILKVQKINEIDYDWVVWWYGKTIYELILIILSIIFTIYIMKNNKYKKLTTIFNEH